MDTKRILQIIVLILLAGIAWLIMTRNEAPADDQYASVTDFATCRDAGGAVTEGDRDICRLPDGRSYEEPVEFEAEVVLDYPKYGDTVTSPLTVVGKARGTWYFEANLPVTLKDDQGNILAQVGAMAQEDWMTTEYVPFSVTLNFDPGEAEFGVLLVEKDNASGLPEFDASYAIPVRFK